MIHAAEAHQGRTFIARLLPGQDLMRGLEHFLREKGIHAGYIPVLQGGFSNLKLVSMTFGEQEDCPHDVELKYQEPLEYFGQGTIAEVEGKPSVHIHLSAAQAGNKGITGHLVSGQVVLVTEIVIVELLGVTVTREADPNVFNLPLLHFQ